MADNENPDDTVVPLVDMGSRLDRLDDALCPAVAELEAVASRGELSAGETALKKVLDAQMLALCELAEGVRDIGDGLNGAIAVQSDQIEAYSFLLAGIGNLAMPARRSSRSELFNLIVRAPGYEPSSDRIEPILRRLLGMPPKLTIVTPDE